LFQETTRKTIGLPNHSTMTTIMSFPYTQT